MRILFAGTPDFALPSLRAVHGHYKIVAVLTNPDSVGGRGRKTTISPVKLCAESLGIPVLQPQTLNVEARDKISMYKPNLLVVAAYGKIFGPQFLALFAHGGINLHPSLLPKYRGPAPIPASILAGDQEGGISIQQIDLKMDAGCILIQEKFPIVPDATTLNIDYYTAQRGAVLLVEAIRQIKRGTHDPQPQDESLASYCGFIRKEDALIDWRSSAVQIDRMIRAYLPWPIARTSLDGKVLQILEARRVRTTHHVHKGNLHPGLVCGIDKEHGILIQTGDGVLALRRLQLQARRILDWQSFINGFPTITSSCLGG